MVVDGDEPPVPPGVLEAHLGPRRWEATLARLRPFDEHDRAVEVRLEVSPLALGDVLEAVEVEVRYGQPACVGVADRERGARDRAGDAERAAGAAYERRLAGAELAGHQHDVARVEARGQERGDALGLLGRGRLEHSHGRKGR